MNGVRIGQNIAGFKAWFLWTFPFLRKPVFHNKYLKDVSKKASLKELFNEIKIFSRISLMKCDYCEAIGIDHYADKHGWEYEGHHFWSCPKCKEKKGE